MLAIALILAITLIVAMNFDRSLSVVFLQALAATVHSDGPREMNPRREVRFWPRSTQADRLA